MVIRVLKPGKVIVPPQYVWRGTCRRCRAELECDDSDGPPSIAYCEETGGPFKHIKCPTAHCSESVEMKPQRQGEEPTPPPPPPPPLNRVPDIDDGDLRTAFGCLLVAGLVFALVIAIRNLL